MKLSPHTRALIERTFDAPDRKTATDILSRECGNNLPFCETYDEFDMERIRFAAIKISDGKLARLQEAIELAKRDWRDVLVWADFGQSADAHKIWARKILGDT